MNILLASASKRRFELLTALGHEVTVKPADVVEVEEYEGRVDAEVALFNAKLKANYVFSHYGLLDSQMILGADTVVLVSGLLLGKAADKNEAEAMLEKLSGKTHVVATGYHLIGKDHRESRIVESQVEFRKLSLKEIKSYVSTNDWQDKAGAYGVQTLGASLVRKVNGSITNVIGLPIEELLLDARKFDS